MRERDALLALTRIALSDAEAAPPDMAEVDADELLRLAQEQGVTGIAWSGYERIHERLTPTHRLPAAAKLRWFAAAQHVERATTSLSKRAAEWAEALHREDGLRCVVLKGIDYARLYPHAAYREYGDLDCWMEGRADAGDDVARRLGAYGDAGDYKHSHLCYRGLTVENHRYFTSHDFTPRGLRAEARLAALMTSAPCRPIGDTRLLSPPPAFTAVFLLRHACGHFLAEGIRLRHVTDWLQFVRHHADVLRDEAVQTALRDARLTAFSEVMTACCVRYLGLETEAAASVPERRLRAFTADLFAARPSLADRRPRVVARRILRRFGRMWRFRALLDEAYVVRVANTFRFSHFFKKK